MLFVVLCPGTPEGSTGSVSGFKASQKMGHRLKVSSDSPILGVNTEERKTKPGIEPATPGLQDKGLSPTPRRLRRANYGYKIYLKPKVTLHFGLPIISLLFLI